MVLDPASTGISRTLIAQGIREEATTRAFQAQLKHIRDGVPGGAHALDIGTNIGYYALMMADILGPNASILSVEPDPKNSDLFARSVKLNEYEDIIHFEPVALVGDSEDTPDTAELLLSERSNLNFMSEIDAPGRPSVDTFDKIDVPAETVPGLLGSNQVTPGEINVIRMDIEGYEAKIFPDTAEIFEQSDRLVCNVEVHPPMMSQDELTAIIDMLEDNEMEVVSAVYRKRQYTNISYNRLREFDDANVEIVARKGISSPQS
jgi:FkbM family methyltransferase